MKKKQYIRWAITGECGLYVGQRLTRKDAIAEHVSHLYDISPYVTDRLDDAQSEAWEHCKKKGDHAVKIRIILIQQQGGS